MRRSGHNFTLARVNRYLFMTRPIVWDSRVERLSLWLSVVNGNRTFQFSFLYLFGGNSTVRGLFALGYRYFGHPVSHTFALTGRGYAVDKVNDEFW